jgi:hypothetical protein
LVLIVAGSYSLALAGCKSMGKDSSFDATINYWNPETNGDMVVSAGKQPNTGTPVRLDNDLDLGDDNQFFGGLDLRMGKHRFGVDYEPLSFHGTDLVEVPFVFHGATYPNSDHVTTDLDLTTYGASWSYLLSEPKRRSADAFWLGIGAWWWNYDARVRGSVSNNDERRSFSHVYPGVTGQWTLDMSKGATLDITGTFCLDKIDSRIWDVAAGGAYAVSDGARLVVGYRYQHWDFDEGDSVGDFTLLGPYAALSMRF